MSWYDILTWSLVGSTAFAAPIIVNQSPQKVNTIPPPAPIIRSAPGATSTPPIIQAAPSERVRVKVSVSRLEDLKVRQGDHVNKGQIIADRDFERSRLLAAKRELQRSLEEILGGQILEPPAPKAVPPIAKLPSANFKEEIAAIAQARLRLNQAERAYAAQEQLLKSEPLGESAEVERQRVKLDQAQQAIARQETKLVAVQDLKNLPQSVMIHEQKVLEQLQAAAQQEQAELTLKQSNLTNSSASRAEKLAALGVDVEQARASLSLTEARLATAQSRRQEQEYQHSITIARRTEEENQSQQIYARQMQEVADQKRSRDFQVAQLRAKVQDVDNQLLAIAAIRTPINGTIRRIKNLGQDNNVINIELTIVSSGSDRSPSALQPFTTPSAAGDYDE